MKELDIEFQGTGEVSNFKFIQIACSIHVYVYEISDDNNNLHYEIFERREQQKRDTLIHGIKVSFDEKVLYPSSSWFGDWAWCYTSKESAMRRFEELNSRLGKTNPKDETLSPSIAKENILELISNPEQTRYFTQLKILW